MDDHPDHYFDLEAAERAAWDAMVRGALSRKSAFHQVTVATIGDDGAPEARTVVLRAADRAEKSLRFHTDTRSGKFSELTRDPRLTFLFYDHGAKVQVRAQGRAELHNRDDVTAGIWREMRDFSKKCYRQAEGPGAALAAPDGAEADPLDDAGGYDNFVVVVSRIHTVEWLYLAAAGHRRARVHYDPPADRGWLAP
ncbi:MAG: pyridoxamine 5'-phosphate oxidase family protein [Pseudomonadota bacterium]